MSALNLRQFGGVLPRVMETDLPANAATVAENIDFAYNELRSLNGDFRMRELAIAARSVFSEDGLRFYAWGEDVDAVPSPLQAGEAHDRLYYTTESDFRVTPLSLATVGGSTPTTSYRVGVPRPTKAPRVTVEHPAEPVMGEVKLERETTYEYNNDTGKSELVTESDEAYAKRLEAAVAAEKTKFEGTISRDTETRVYAYTYANIYNEEGPPSGPTVVEVKSITVGGVTTSSKVTVTVEFDSISEYVPIKAARIYRTSNTGSSSDYFFSFELAVTLPEGPDTTTAAMLNEALSSLSAYPPEPALKGLFNIGNGILCAWKGREIWFSEAYRPWSWPPEYVVTLPHAIVGAVQHGTGALVTTVAEPCLISGVSPDAMTQIPLQIAQAGASKWSLISIGGVAVYACHDGLVTIDGGTPNYLLSERFFTREVWRKLYAAGLSTMQFARYDGRLIVFSKANKFVPFMVDLSDGGHMTILPSFKATTALVLTTSDQMYTVDGTGLYQFGGGTPLPLRWKSGDIVLPAPATLGAAQVECTGAFSVKFYQGDVLGYTEHVTTGSTSFRLPSGPIPGHAGLEPSDRWTFEITGTGRFKWLKAASSFRGLKEA